MANEQGGLSWERGLHHIQWENGENEGGSRMTKTQSNWVIRDRGSPNKNQRDRERKARES